MGNFLSQKLFWTRKPEIVTVAQETAEIVTEPHTDLWQRTYYGFRNDNAPVLQMTTDEKFFSFVVKTEFAESHHRFDQCGIAVYLDSENWLKASIEYENEKFQRLGSVVTNHGYSDWATTDIPAGVKEMWLTHYSPSLIRPDEYMDMVRGIFPNAYPGKDGKTMELNFEED